MPVLYDFDETGAMIAPTTKIGRQMLIRYEVSNFRSILEPIELSMVAIDRDRSATREAPNLGESLLTTAAIYGPNASGKSNLIASMAWLREAVAYSLRVWDEEIPIEQFAFSEGQKRPTTFGIEMLIDGTRFEYNLELDGRAVSYEGLFHYPERKRRRIFEREGGDLKLQRGLGNLSGTRELLTGRTLALSVARRFDEPLVTSFAYSLLDMQIRGLSRHLLGSGLGRRSMWRDHQPTRALFDDSAEPQQQSLFDVEVDLGTTDERRTEALALLKLADLGIDDVIFPDADEATTLDGKRAVRPRRVFQLVHKTEHQSIPLDFNAESNGTRAWFQLIGPLLSALKLGSILLFDELDASLHPTLSAQLIRIFQAPETNPRGAQLIFTSHDTSLLNELNRDEVWLTEKSSDGATRLGALADFAGERVRRSVNLESAYLHGRFGALPDVDRTELLRALKLIG